MSLLGHTTEYGDMSLKAKQNFMTYQLFFSVIAENYPDLHECILFQLTIEAYLGSDFMGDVAVDDIVVASGGCAVYPAEAARGVNYVPPSIHTQTEVPPTTPSPGPFDCTFEEDLCSWSSTIGEVRTGLHA